MCGSGCGAGNGEAVEVGPGDQAGGGSGGSVHLGGRRDGSGTTGRQGEVEPGVGGEEGAGEGGGALQAWPVSPFAPV